LRCGPGDHSVADQGWCGYFGAAAESGRGDNVRILSSDYTSVKLNKEEGYEKSSSIGSSSDDVSNGFRSGGSYCKFHQIKECYNE
jgi:hypothetical protein